MNDLSRRCLKRRFVLGISLLAVLAAQRSGRASGAGANCASFDFAGQLSRAAVEPETRWLAPGTPAARPHLLSGWSIDELWHDQFPFVWAMGDAAALRFTRFATGPFDLYFRCQPIDLAGAPPQEVAILVNGTQVGVTELQPDFQIYRMPIPAAVLRSGENRLDLRFAHFRVPAPAPKGFPQPRRLAVAWNWIGFGAKAPPTPRTTPPPQPSAEAGSLSLPFLTCVEFEAKVQPGNSLRWRKIRPWRTSRLGPGAALEVTIDWAGPQSRALRFEQRAFSSPVDVALTNRQVAPARISFLARPGKSAGAETSGLTIELPQLLAAGCPSLAGTPAVPAVPGRAQPSTSGW